LEVLYVDIYVGSHTLSLVVTHLTAQDQPEGGEKLTRLQLPIKHLTLNFCWRTSFTGVQQDLIWTKLFWVLALAPLESLTFRTSDPGETMFPVHLGGQLVHHWGRTLRRLNAVEVGIPDCALKTICEGAKHLEQLTIRIPRYSHLVTCPHPKHPFTPC
jgi:hypothetical protein